MDWKTILSTAWDVCKVIIFPVCLFLLERQIRARDDRREREYNERKQQLDKQNEDNLRLQLLMMQRMDKLSEMTHLMAQKLHDKGVINGDLETLDRKYKELDDEYEREVHRLALIANRGTH